MSDIAADLVPWCIFLLPFAVFAFLVHKLEIWIQSRLAFRFGWNSVLFTGWIGTPIHELSHALFCVIFRHRIDEIKLFEPDKNSGRLGYVRHSYRGKSFYQEVGNFFIGIAPLICGTAVLIGLLLLFYPSILNSIGEQSQTDELAWFEKIGLVIKSTIGEVLDLKNLVRWQFWLFMYLTLCVSSHMAPSRSDYEGGKKGAILLGVTIFVIAISLSLLGLGDQVRSVLGSIVRPMIGIYSVALVICTIGFAVVYILTGLYDLITMRES